MIVHLDASEIAEAVTDYLADRIGLKTQVDSVRVKAGLFEAVIKTGAEPATPPRRRGRPRKDGDGHQPQGKGADPDDPPSGGSSAKPPDEGRLAGTSDPNAAKPITLSQEQVAARVAERTGGDLVSRTFDRGNRQ